MYSKLIQVDGLGAWSVNMFLLFKLQRPNVFAVGDLGVKKGIAKLHGLSDAQWKKMKEPQFLELVQVPGSGVNVTKGARRIPVY